MSSEPCEDRTCNRIVNAYGTKFKQFVQGDYTKPINDGHTIKEGGCGICSTAALLTGYGHDVDPEAIVKKKDELGLKWYPDNGQRADNIQKIFASYGITGQWKLSGNSTELKTILEEAFNARKPVIIRISANSVGPWTSGAGHYFGVIGVDNGTLYTVDSAGRSDGSRLVNQGGLDALINSVGACTLGVFVPDTAPDGSTNTASVVKEFEGFEGEEPVIAPVTGEVIKYGTVKRKNLEATEEGEDAEKEVGFIKIRVLGDDEAIAGAKEGCTFFGDEEDEKGYNYFWEEYADAGITNHVLYIEGFDVSKIFEEQGKKIDSGNKKKNIRVLEKYIEASEDNDYFTDYEIPKLVDEEKMKELQAKETAKEDAAYMVKVEGKDKKEHFYIKEGAVIGYTYTAEKAEKEGLTEERKVGEESYSVGNYLRIIFRDTDDQVVENVENYMEIDELETATGQQTEKFSIVGTVLSKNEFVQLTVAYATSHGAKAPFTDAKSMGELYDMCVDKGVNPEFIIAKGVQESQLKNDQNIENFWGMGTPNGEALKNYGGWKPTVEAMIQQLLNYQNPTNSNYTAIMARYEERKKCTEWGGADPQGYGTPDTLEGISSRYSWLGDDHLANTSGDGGMYYLYPWSHSGNQYEGENKIIFETKQEFEQKCGSLHGTSGGKTSSAVTTVWEQAAYTAWQVRKTITIAKGIYGDVAGTYKGK